MDKLPVVRIKSTSEEYYNLQDAIGAVTVEGETIEFIRDVIYTSTASAVNIPSDKNIILDINGKKVSLGSSKFITNNGTLKITDSQNLVDATGIITGNLTINSGLVQGREASVKNIETGNFEFVGGKLFGSTSSNDEVPYGIYNNTSGILNITGGQIETYTNQRYGQGSIGIENILGDVTIKNVTMDIKNNGSKAIDNKSGNKITFENNTITSSSSVVNNEGEIIIESGLFKGYSFNNSGTVTINDGELIGSSGDWWHFFYNSGTLTMFNVTILFYSRTDGSEPAAISNTGTVIINNGNISSSYVGIDSSKNVTVVGGTIKGNVIGIRNISTLTLGTNDEVVSNESPIIIGNTSGVTNKTDGIFNFYHGI